ncbi:cardiolipin synthase [Patescibacteria group bacterium]|nr:cardiolipin synthase [Patescibacteria group bacterium]
MRQKLFMWAGSLLLLIAVGVTVSGDFFTHYSSALRHESFRQAQDKQAAVGQLVSPLEIKQVPPEYFSLLIEPDAGITPVLSRIEHAQKSIDLVMYTLSDDQVVQALGDAVTRGVSVRVLLNGGYYSKKESSNDASYAALQKLHVPVKWTPTSFALTHQKTLVVDGKEALVMTFNLQSKYYKTGRDFAIADTDPNDIAAIEKVFAADFAGSYVEPQQGDTLLWSPGSEDELLYLIKSASSTLDIYNEEMADKDITEALVVAAKRGVKVRVDMTYATNWKPAFIKLRDGGVAVRTFPSSSKTLYIHAKVIIADGTTAFMGSENFSETSLNKNRELGVVTSAPQIVGGLQHIFDIDWAKSRPFTASK